MADLMLQPDVEGRGNDYEVIADGQAVGRISLFNSSPAGTPWMWSIDFTFHDSPSGDARVLGHARAAMQAFALSWHRET